MIAVLINLLAYFFLTVFSFLNFGLAKHTKKEKGWYLAMTLFGSFVSAYLFKNYHKILNSPLNIELNIFETITNSLFLAYVIYDFLRNYNQSHEHKQ